MKNNRVGFGAIIRVVAVAVRGGVAGMVVAVGFGSAGSCTSIKAIWVIGGRIRVVVVENGSRLQVIGKNSINFGRNCICVGSAGSCTSGGKRMVVSFVGIDCMERLVSLSG